MKRSWQREGDIISKMYAVSGNVGLIFFAELSLLEVCIEVGNITNGIPHLAMSRCFWRILFYGYVPAQSSCRLGKK
jgi:hypothetical protein